MQVSRTALDSGQNVSMAVVEAVADALEVSSTELEPLHRVVDGDALNDLFDPNRGASDATTRIVFTYEGCEVTVSGDCEVVVRPPDESDLAQSP